MVVGVIGDGSGSRGDARVALLPEELEAEATCLSEALNLRPGAMVAEIGAGKGQLTLVVAQQVGPRGRVLSTEFEPKKLRKISRSVQKHGVENVTILHGSQTESELPPESCDAIFMRGVFTITSRFRRK